MTFPLFSGKLLLPTNKKKQNQKEFGKIAIHPMFELGKVFCPNSEWNTLI